MEFPRLTTEYLREFLVERPDATVEEFIEVMRTRYQEAIKARAEQEAKAILTDFRAAVAQVLEAQRRD